MCGFLERRYLGRSFVSSSVGSWVGVRVRGRTGMVIVRQGGFTSLIGSRHGYLRVLGVLACVCAIGRMDLALALRRVYRILRVAPRRIRVRQRGKCVHFAARGKVAICRVASLLQLRGVLRVKDICHGVSGGMVGLRPLGGRWAVGRRRRSGGRQGHLMRTSLFDKFNTPSLTTR